MNGRWKDHKLKVPEPPTLVCLAVATANMVSCRSIIVSSLLESFLVSRDPFTEVVGEGTKSLDGGLQRTCVTDAEIERTCFAKTEVGDFDFPPEVLRMNCPTDEILDIAREECLFEKVEKHKRWSDNGMKKHRSLIHLQTDYTVDHLYFLNPR
jgi:hypothetical protein